MLKLRVWHRTGLLQKHLSVGLHVGIADLLVCVARSLLGYFGVNKQ